jgi:hypothetical protein
MQIIEHHDPPTARPIEPAALLDRAAVAGVFASGLTAAVFASRRAGVRLPSRIAAGDLATLGIATFKLSRLITKDRVTSFARAPFVEFQRNAGHGEVEERPRGTGLRRAVGELVVCPYCIGVWVATALIGGLIVAPRATRVASGALAVVAIADALQMANHAVESRI